MQTLLLRQYYDDIRVALLLGNVLQSERMEVTKAITTKPIRYFSLDETPIIVPPGALILLNVNEHLAIYHNDSFEVSSDEYQLLN
jgi:hypothetical protein